MAVLNIPFNVMAPRQTQDGAHSGLGTACAAALVWHDAAAGSHFDLFLEPQSARPENGDRRLALSWRLAADPRVSPEAAIRSPHPLPAHRLAWARMRRQEVLVTSSGERCTCVESGVVEWAPDSGGCASVTLGGVRLKWPCTHTEGD